MKIAIDTQILLWYFSGKSPYTCNRINELSVNNEIYIFDNIFSEFCDVLFRNKIVKLNKKEWIKNCKYIEDILLYKTFFKWIANAKPIELKVITRDPKDDLFINNAITHKMDLIISNDKDLLEIRCGQMPIKSLQEIHKHIV